MKDFRITAIATAISLAFSVGAMAEEMSKGQYEANQENIEAIYDAARASCDSSSGNANDICMADAKGRERVALAELEAAYRPTDKTRYNVRVAKANANYAVAEEKCDDTAGNIKDVCLEEANAAETAAKADATTQIKTSKAQDSADEKSADAQMEANEEALDARQDGAAAKRDADYAVAKEKCDALASDAKDACMNAAKTQFGKS